MEEVFSLNFQASFNYFGETKTFDLIENGGDITLTQENKQQYVDLYSKWILETSIEKQFGAFLTGFKYVCSGTFFDLFRVEEVELLVCGEPELDFEALQDGTVYEGGYDENDLVIM